MCWMLNDRCIGICFDLSMFISEVYLGSSVLFLVCGCHCRGMSVYLVDSFAVILSIGVFFLPSFPQPSSDRKKGKTIQHIQQLSLIGRCYTLLCIRQFPGWKLRKDVDDNDDDNADDGNYWTEQDWTSETFLLECTQMCIHIVFSLCRSVFFCTVSHHSLICLFRVHVPRATLTSPRILFDSTINVCKYIPIHRTILHYSHGEYV